MTREEPTGVAAAAGDTADRAVAHRRIAATAAIRPPGRCIEQLAGAREVPEGR